MPPPPRVTIQLKNAKTSETGPEAMEQLFSALPKTKGPLIPFLGSPEPISFEIISHQQSTSFQVNAPGELAHYVKSQLIAAYPEITMNDAARENHILLPLFEHPHATTTLSLSQGQFYPLKTYKDFPETDPLSAVLSTLSKLGPGQSAVIQVLVAPVKDGWKRRGYQIAAGSTDSEGKVTPHPYKDLIEHKLSLVGHRVAIKIAAFGNTQQEAKDILSNITGSFATITHAKSNFLSVKNPWFGQAGLANSFPYRTFEKTTKQHFSVEELATIFHLPFKTTKDIKNLAWGKTLLGEPPENLPTHTHTPPEEREQVNFFAKTEFKNESQIFGIKDEDRRRHMYVIGKSGTGKSTLLGNMVVNDMKHGKGIAVIDPHGDLIEAMLNYIPSSRINDVIYLNPADPDYTVRLNLLEDTGLQFKELISSGVIAIFKKLYAHSWGPRLEYILRNTLLTLVEKDQATMEDIIKLLTNKKYLQRTLEKTRDPVLRNFWENEWAQMPDRQRSEAISPILNKIGQFVTSPLIRNVINSPTSSFSIEEAMNEGKILLCNLSQGKLGEDNAALMGAMLITKIQLAAMNRVYIPEEQRKDFTLYVDEFQNFATTSFIKILSEARKYRLNLVMANQYVEQIEPEVRHAIFGNCGTLATFLVGAGDATLLSQEFGQQYTPEDLVSIQNHQIVLKLMVDGTQSHPFPAFTLPPAASTNNNREKVIKVSNERYAKKKIKYDDRPDPHMNSMENKPNSDNQTTSSSPDATKKNIGSHSFQNTNLSHTSLPEGQEPTLLADPPHPDQLTAQAGPSHPNTTSETPLEPTQSFPETPPPHQPIVNQNQPKSLLDRLLGR